MRKIPVALQFVLIVDHGISTLLSAVRISEHGNDGVFAQDQR
jgi:hypothetical protein